MSLEHTRVLAVHRFETIPIPRYKYSCGHATLSSMREPRSPSVLLEGCACTLIIDAIRNRSTLEWHLFPLVSASSLTSWAGRQLVCVA